MKKRGAVGRGWALSGLCMAMMLASSPVRAQHSPSDNVAAPAANGTTGELRLTHKPPRNADLFRDPKKLIGLAQRLEAQGDPEKALRFAQSALAANGRYRPALEMVARLSLQLSRPEALAQARAWVAAEPRNRAAHLQLSDALLFEAQLDEVTAHLAKAKNLGASAADLALRSGILKDLEGDPKAAQDIYAAALAQKPDAPALMLAMALSLSLSGDGQAGLQMSQKLANLPEGDTPATRAAIARIYAANGDVEIAQRIMEAQVGREGGREMQPFLARIAQLKLRDKAWALHFSRITREALRADIEKQETAATAVPPVDVRIHRGTQAAPAALVSQSAATKSITGDHYYVQLAAMRAQAGLADIWAQLRTNASALLAQKSPLMARIDDQYRLLIGPYPNLDDARAMIGKLQAQGVHAMPRLLGADVRIEEMK